jgi:hypothetical protein
MLHALAPHAPKAGQISVVDAIAALVKRPKTG